WVVTLAFVDITKDAHGLDTVRVELDGSLCLLERVVPTHLVGVGLSQCSVRFRGVGCDLSRSQGCTNRLVWVAGPVVGEGQSGPGGGVLRSELGSLFGGFDCRGEATAPGFDAGEPDEGDGIVWSSGEVLLNCGGS